MNFLTQMAAIVPLVSVFLFSLGMLAFSLPETPNSQRRSQRNQKFGLTRE